MIAYGMGESCCAIVHYLKTMENNLKRLVEIISQNLGRFYFPRKP